VAITEYPRVLIVYMTCLNQADQHGVSLRSWFTEWPRERLAQLYSSADLGHEKFCGYTFQIGPAERRWGRLFFKLKQSSLGESSRPVSLPETPIETVIDVLKPVNHLALMRSRLSLTLVRSGLWEILFPPRLSHRLERWVKEFNPQAIYCQGYSLAFAWLPVMLWRRFQIPVCFQTGDDWPDYLYKDSAVAWLVRPVVQRAVYDLLASATVRFANGDRMATEYQARYGCSFIPVMMGDSFERFRETQSRRVSPTDEISVVYTGNLGQGRWQSLVDLCAAGDLLRSEGYCVRITGFASTVPAEAVNILKRIADLQILPPPAHELVPAFLKGANILFLPETFDVEKAAEIRLSISTKAHLYMMSERPILVYGSSITGIVDYAKRDGWALVVDERNIHRLAEALRRLIIDIDLQKSLIKRGTEVARQNHDEVVIRRRFLTSLNQMVANPVVAG
jgi:hypothetical protein